MIKKLLFVAFLGTSSVVSLGAADLEYGKGKVFVGPEIGFFAGYGGDVGIGVAAGYQHYFDKDWQPIKLGWRHGIRAYGVLAYEYYKEPSSWEPWRYSIAPEDYPDYSPHRNGIAFNANVDYVLEFNPASDTVWGIYAGLGIGYVYFGDDRYKNFDAWRGSSSYYKTSSIMFTGEFGGSVTLDKKHRFDLSLGYNKNLIHARYLYMF